MILALEFGGFTFGLDVDEICPTVLIFQEVE